MLNNKVKRPISIAIAAMGGQGGGVLANWIINAAEHSDFLTQYTSVPGLAQRTGTTIYYLEIFPRLTIEQTGKIPVMALMPAPGDVDIVIAGELMEAGRAILRGIVTPDKTVLIASTHRDYALSEKMALADGRADKEKTLAFASQSSKQFIGFDMLELAESTGSFISSILLGALAGSGTLTIQRQAFEAAIRENGVAVDANLAGFSAGFDYARKANRTTGTANAGSGIKSSNCDIEKTQSTAVNELVQRVRNDFADSTQDILLHGIKRLIDYQDVAYARTYLDRLDKIMRLEANRNEPPDRYKLIRETARYLALWMTYEDTIRVADLKIRSSRISRLRKEIRAKPDELIRVTEFMHPRVQEICDTLPTWLGNFILNSTLASNFIGLFCKKGRKIRTTNISGFLLLYFIASLRRWRLSSYRYQLENAGIENWLDRIISTATDDYPLAVEIAECQRLIKGYGDTHARGMKSFRSIMALIDNTSHTKELAKTVRQLREAALADESGQSLQESLEKVA